MDTNSAEKAFHRFKERGQDGISRDTQNEQRHFLTWKKYDHVNLNKKVKQVLKFI